MWADGHHTQTGHTIQQILEIDQRYGSIAGRQSTQVIYYGTLYREGREGEGGREGGTEEGTEGVRKGGREGKRERGRE